MPTPGLILALAIALLGPPLTVQGGGAQVDPELVRQGIDLRLGPEAEGWSIEVSGTDPARIDLRLHPPEGEPFHRDVSLAGSTPEERSRELASALVLIIESHEPTEPIQTPPPVEPMPTEPEPSPRGWIAASGRLGLGPPDALDLDGGIELAGGVWLLSEYLQPMIEVGWSRSSRGDLEADGVRFGPGLAAGAPVARGRLWVGGVVVARALWARAADATRVAEWSSSTFVGPLLQVRWRWLLATLRFGVDLTAPGLRFVGDTDSLRWGVARFSTSLGVGALIPPLPAMSHRR